MSHLSDLDPGLCAALARYSAAVVARDTALREVINAEAALVRTAIPSGDVGGRRRIFFDGYVYEIKRGGIHSASNADSVLRQEVES